MTNIPNWITVPKLDNLTNDENVERERYINCYIQGKDNCAGNWGKTVDATEIITKMNPKSICDVGCGVGNWLSHCMTILNIEKAYGIDPVSIALSRIQTEVLKAGDTPTQGLEESGTLQLHKNIQYIEGTARSIPLPANSVDCVTSFEVLEHVLPQDIDASLKEIARVTKRYAILLVCLVKSTDFNNKNNHPCIMTKEQWQEKIEQHFSSVTRTPCRGSSLTGYKSMMYECSL